MNIASGGNRSAAAARSEDDREREKCGGIGKNKRNELRTSKKKNKIIDSGSVNWIESIIFMRNLCLSQLWKRMSKCQSDNERHQQLQAHRIANEANVKINLNDWDGNKALIVPTGNNATPFLRQKCYENPWTRKHNMSVEMLLFLLSFFFLVSSTFSVRPTKALTGASQHINFVLFSSSSSFILFLHLRFPSKMFVSFEYTLTFIIALYACALCVCVHLCVRTYAHKSLH